MNCECYMLWYPVPNQNECRLDARPSDKELSSVAALYSQGVPIIPKCIYPIDPQVKFHSELRTLDSHMESITLKELILPASYACTEPREMKPHTHTHTHIYIYIYRERES